MSRKKDTSPLSAAFGRAVRKLREKAGYTQESFAHGAGIDRAYFGLIERGGHTPTVTTVWRIAKGLGKRPRDVIAAVESELARYDKLKLAAAKKKQSATPAESSPPEGQSGQVGKPGKRGGKN